ncbi:MAG: hypothetical protein V8Q28_01635 [Alistipes sp.]
MMMLAMGGIILFGNAPEFIGNARRYPLPFSLPHGESELIRWRESERKLKAQAAGWVLQTRAVARRRYRPLDADIGIGRVAFAAIRSPR